MKKIINKTVNLYRENDKKTMWIYAILRILIIICMARELYLGNIQNALLCVLSLILFFLPFFVERKFKVDLPVTLEIIIFLFIFAAEILGEINNFYGMFKSFDTILHTLNGFLCASIGFSLVYLLNENIESFHLSPFFVALVSFCFSMTVGAAWEIFEYSMDQFFTLDMQKDEYVEKIKTVTLDPEQDNQVVTIAGISSTVLYNENNLEIIKLDGYLDIGLHDTMKDLIVNFIGAVVFSIFGYLYILNKEKYHFAEKFLARKRNFE